jgi:hypothetical protein
VENENGRIGVMGAMGSWAQWGQAPMRPFVTFLVENLVVWIKMLTFVPLIQI